MVTHRQQLPLPGGAQLVRISGREPTGWVALDRVADEPESRRLGYCVHGQTLCRRCGCWCWLGDKTYAAVASGDTGALCLPCARELLQDRRPDYNLGDHRRADGPHEEAPRT